MHKGTYAVTIYTASPLPGTMLPGKETERGKKSIISALRIHLGIIMRQKTLHIGKQSSH